MTIKNFYIGIKCAKKKIDCDTHTNSYVAKTRTLLILLFLVSVYCAFALRNLFQYREMTAAFT